MDVRTEDPFVIRSQGRRRWSMRFARSRRRWLLAVPWPVLCFALLYGAIWMVEASIGIMDWSRVGVEFAILGIVGLACAGFAIALAALVLRPVLHPSEICRRCRYPVASVSVCPECGSDDFTSDQPLFRGRDTGILAGLHIVSAIGLALLSCTCLRYAPMMPAMQV